MVLLFLGERLALRLVPLPPALLNHEISEVEFLDRNGNPLRIVRPGDNPFEHQVKYADIPLPLIEATLAAEDHRFWNHGGVDVFATVRALGQLICHGHVVSGGSTISQQVIKLAQPRPRTFRTKILEALQAMRLEQCWDKQHILTEYLNRLDYGNLNRGAAAAAQFYFDKPLHELSPAECAFLAAIPQAPSRLNPETHFERAAKRQQWVLKQMCADGWLTPEELHRDLNEPLILAKPRRIFEAPHFIDLLLALGKSEYQTENSKAPVRTSLDLDLNHFAETTLRSHLASLQPEHVSNGAIVILDNRTGEVLALVGSEDYFSPLAGQVNGAWAPRSTGSTLKPFTYLLALEHGATPASIIADVPTEFATATGLFAPVNYNRHCYGPMRYRLALANSLNISAVKVLASIGGAEPLERLLQRCGMTTLNRPPEDYGLGLTIGNAEARLLELANAYACLARSGTWQPYRMLRSGTDDMSIHQVADPGAAYLVADILADNDARTAAFGAESSLRFDFPVACKTGTSSDFRDNWAFGYTPEFTVGVWVGNPDSTCMLHVSGVTGAAPILHDLFEHLHERCGTTWYRQPTNVIECWINPITGKRLLNQEQSNGPDAVREKFIAQNLPQLESPEDYELGQGQTRMVRLDNEYCEWFATSDNWLGSHAVLFGSANTLKILFPPPGTTVYLDADLPSQGRCMTLKAAGPADLVWHSDTLKLVPNGGQEIALLNEGCHQISVRDPLSGMTAKTWINVLVR